MKLAKELLESMESGGSSRWYSRLWTYFFVTLRIESGRVSHDDQRLLAKCGLDRKHSGTSLNGISLDIAILKMG